MVTATTCASSILPRASSPSRPRARAHGATPPDSCCRQPDMTQPPTMKGIKTMTTYNVHIYREMRLVFGGIRAESHEAAATIARDKPTEHADDIADCDGETFYACVDVQGDE